MRRAPLGLAAALLAATSAHAVAQPQTYILEHWSRYLEACGPLLQDPDAGIRAALDNFPTSHLRASADGSVKYIDWFDGQDDDKSGSVELHMNGATASIACDVNAVDGRFSLDALETTFKSLVGANPSLELTGGRILDQSDTQSEDEAVFVVTNVFPGFTVLTTVHLTGDFIAFFYATELSVSP